MSFAARQLIALAVSKSVTYISKNSNSAPANPTTFTSQNYGGAGLIVVSFSGEGAGATPLPFTSGITLGGVSMTLASRSTSNVSNTGEASIWYLRVSSGSSANIVVSFTNVPSRFQIGVWRIQDNVSDTPTATAALSNQSGNATFNLVLTGSASGNLVVQAGTEGDGPSTGATATYGAAITQDFYDTLGTGGSTTGVDGGHGTAPSANYTATVTTTGNSQFVAATAVSWN